MREPAATSELVSQGVEAVRNMWEATHSLCLSYNDDFRELVDEHESMNGDFLLDFVDLIPSDQQYDAQTGQGDTSSHYDGLTI